MRCPCIGYQTALVYWHSILLVAFVAMQSSLSVLIVHVELGLGCLPKTYHGSMLLCLEVKKYYLVHLGCNDHRSILLHMVYKL